MLRVAVRVSAMHWVFLLLILHGLSAVDCTGKMCAVRITHNYIDSQTAVK